jgi:predicted naringenin-chalcone synthase
MGPSQKRGSLPVESCSHPPDVPAGRAVLQDVGNLSSASVLYVLAEMLRLGLCTGLGLLGAFGTGFNAELLLADFGQASASQWNSQFDAPTVAIT